MQRWRPTFEDYLTRSVQKYGCRSRAIPLEFSTYDNKTRDAEIDFIFPNPTAFQELKDKYGIREFLSVKRTFGLNQELDRFGGVIARAANRHVGVRVLADLLPLGFNMTLCAVDESAFGGWHIQWYELLRVGIDVHRHFRIRFLGNHDRPVLRLLTGECDVAICRTETIESLVDRRLLNASQVFTIGDRSAEFGFPQAVSTILYPEWPVAALKHVPRALEQLVAVPLLTMERTSPEAIAASHAGFSFPYPYDPVRELLLALDLAGTGECNPGYARQPAFPRQCEACPAGKYSSTGFGDCALCPVGYVTSQSGSTACIFCPDGLTTIRPGGTLGDCALPPVVPVATFSEGGELLNLSIGGFAVVIVGITLMCVKRRGGSLLAALDVLSHSVLPNLAAVSTELSDLASDIACAVGVLVLGSDAGLGRTLRTLYVLGVGAGLIPSLLNLLVRLRNITELGKVFKLGQRPKIAPQAGRNSATTSTRELLKLNTPRPDPERSDQSSCPSTMAKDVTAAMADEGGLTHVGVSDMLDEHATRTEHALLLASRRARTMIVMLAGLLFEDTLMAVLNVVVLVQARDSEKFRTSRLYWLVSFGAITSLFNLGLKAGLVSSWAMYGRRESAALERKHAHLKQMCSSPSALQVLDVTTVQALGPCI